MNVALDTCATNNFIRLPALAALGLQTQSTDLTTVSFGESGRTRVREKTQLMLSSIDNDFTLRLSNVHVVKEICTEVSFHDGTREYLDDIDILLSSWISFSLIKEINPEGLVRTSLGSTHLKDCTDIDNVKSISLVIVNDDELNAMLQRFWECENSVLDPATDKDNEVLAKHQRAADLVYTRTVFEDGKYVMPLLFKEGVDRPKNNFPIALQRLKGQERRFVRDPALKPRYSAAINEHIEKYASLVPADEIDSEYAYYLPHSAVIRDEKSTTKTRIVFDASSKGVDGVSLNDRLLTGPPIHPDMVGILLRFRTHRVCLTGDISKMFLQIKLFDEDKKYHRFLWRDDPKSPVRHYQMDVTTFGLGDSPYKSIMCIRMHVMQILQSIDPSSEADRARVTTLLAILVDMFVDDLLSGAANDDLAYEMFENLVSILKSAGFHICKFLSNSPDLMARIPEELRGSVTEVNLTENVEDSESLTKALGVAWCIRKDILTYNVLDYDEEAEVTKRTMSSDIARLYDMPGYIAPFVMQGKIMLQKTWVDNTAWDSRVSEELARQFLAWRDQVQLLSSIKIPRCIYMSNDYKRVELHVFSDASEKAMGAAVYVKVFYDQFIDSRLIYAKGKVASLKDLTLPRKELVGIVIGARIVRHAAFELNISDKNIYCHTDSLTAWQWVQKAADEWKLYVRNRVKIVQSLVDISRLFWVPGVENPADLVSRGCDVKDLTDFWFYGPSFLREQQPMCPKPQFDDASQSNRCLEEKRVKKAKALISCIPKAERLHEIVWRISNFRTFLNVTSYCMRVFSQKTTVSLVITDNERQNALLFWVRQAQLENFKEDYQRLAIDTEISGKSRLKPLNPFYDNVSQCLRVGGRLQEADLTFGQMHPIVLPPPHVKRLRDINDDITARIVMDIHERHCHAGADWVINHLRLAGFWLLRGKESVRRVITKCVACQKAIKRKDSQLMGNLPAYRLTSDEKPFSFVGVDAAGPLYLKQKPWESGQAKVYVMVFTCLTTRAIHLELAMNQHADTLLQCIRRLIARRGTVKEFLSDNHKTNVRANKEISVLMDITTPNHDFTWRFLPEHGPWYGAVYERLIRSVKDSLRKVIGKSALDEWELLTLLAEIEAMINDRPLCAVSEDIAQFEPVTPSMLLTGHQLSHMPSNLPRSLPKDKTEAEIVRAWKRRVSLSQQLWNRWKKDYMLGLQVRQKWMTARKDLELGDLVLIATENMPRGSWPLARVTSTENVHNLRDVKSANIRSVELRLSSGKLTRRPCQHLVRLEVQ